MTNPVVALVSEIYENDNNFPNLACELVTSYPDYTFATYHVASAILALSLRLGLSDRPDDLIGTLSVKSSVCDRQCDQFCSRVLWLATTTLQIWNH